ncbi:MAG: 50S ribosomal protein L22 [Clostridiales bacterium]|jgi:large subunit ribosomal protein L22|nr:50S ribosomal protein L22 [Clostridiales bacterium]
MAKGHRSQIKKGRNEGNKDIRPKAHARFVRVSDSKARIVLEQIKGKDVSAAVGILTYSPRYAASVILKVLKSAMANAENNLGYDPQSLYVEEVFANQGPTLKRIQPRARGQAYRILKRSSHISVILNRKE